MTSSNGKRVLAGLTVLTLCIPYQASWASLGDNERSIESDRTRMHARRAVRAQASFTVHELTTADGSRIRQFVDGSGNVFAVSWNAQHKPDLPSLLGSSSFAYTQAVRVASAKGGIQRQFRHASGDLVVHSNAHLHLFAGYAMRPSMVPAGFVSQDYGMQ
jgi:Protein of unknown function (DUF2844)